MGILAVIGTIAVTGIVLYAIAWSVDDDVDNLF